MIGHVRIFAQGQILTVDALRAKIAMPTMAGKIKGILILVVMEITNAPARNRNTGIITAQEHPVHIQ